MAETTRKSVLAIKKEVTSGTPVMPTAGTDFVTLQDGFELIPSFETLDNVELSPNVGSKAPILGIEAPTASVSHYFRHSGVEGTAPNYDELVESAVGLKVAAHATERLLDAGSTAGSATAAATAVFLAGQGADFQRGKAVLLKDAVNGYAIRNIESMATDTATLGFNLAGAPAAGVATGKAVLYKPDDAPPSLTLALYRGNGAALEVEAGARVAELSIEASAGELLNMSFSLEGTAYHFDPIEITSADRYLDFNETGPTLRAATVATGLYKDPHELAEAIQIAMNGVATDAITVKYNDSGANAGKFTISSAGALLELLWSSGTNTANTIGDKIGFVTASDDTGAVTYTSDNVQSWAAPYTPSADTNANPLVVKASELMVGDFDDYGCSGAQSFTLTVTNTLQNVPDVCAVSGISEKLLSQREVSAAVVLTLAKHDAEKFKKFRKGDDIRLAFNGGVKDGGQWVAGRCVNVYMPQCKVSEYSVTDTDGIVTIELTVVAYVPASGAGEVFINFV